MEHRDLQHGIETIPRDRTAFLLRMGGRNPYGEPNLRLVACEGRYVKIAGEFAEWDPSIPVEERMALRSMRIVLDTPEPVYATIDGKPKKLGERSYKDVMVPTHHRPTRTWVGVKEVRVYHYDGIVLEQWRPPHCFGTREAWDAVKCEGIPVLGPYPERGDYMAMVGPWDVIPTLSVLEKAVAYVESKARERAEMSDDTAMRVRLNHALREADKCSENYKHRMEALIKDRAAFLLSSSLEAGRLRTEYGEKAGIRHHIGN